MTPNHRSQSGFSLIELVIALFVAMLVLIPAAVYVTGLSRQTSLAREQEGTSSARELVAQKLSASGEAAGRHISLFLDDPANSTTYADEVKADSPRVWYRFDDLAGSTTLADNSGNKSDATITGTVTFNRPSALASDPDASVNLAGRSSGTVFAPNIGTPSAGFSVEWWLNPATLTNFGQFISSNRAGAYTSWGFVAMADGSVYCGSSSASSINPTDVPPGTVKTGEWQHFVFTYSNGNGSLFRNGALLATKPLVPASGWDTMSLQDINGDIDELAVYFTPLTPERVRAHYIAAVAPPVPQDTAGYRLPTLPLVKWPGTSFARPDGPVMVSQAQDKILFLYGDDTFSPTQTRAAFTAGSGAQTLTTREGTRARPAAGDYLLVIDYETKQTSLVKVTGDVTESSSTYIPSQLDWGIPVEPVMTDAPAWGMLASDAPDLASPLRAGSTVIRLAPPVGYYRKNGRLVRSVGLAEETLATAAASFTAQRVTGTPNQSWAISYLVEGEAVEGSTDDNWKQKEAASLRITPPALNPPPAIPKN